MLRNTYIACLLLLSSWYIPVGIQPLSPIIHLNIIYKRKDSIHAKQISILAALYILKQPDTESISLSGQKFRPEIQGIFVFL